MSQDSIQNNAQFVNVSSNLFGNVFRNLGDTVKQLQNIYVIEDTIRCEDLLMDIKKNRLLPKSECLPIQEEKLKKLTELLKENKKKLISFINSQKKCLDGMENPVFVRAYYSQQLLRKIAYNIAPRTHKYRLEKNANGIDTVRLQQGVFQQLQMMQPTNSSRRTLMMINEEQAQQIQINEENIIREQEEEYKQNQEQEMLINQIINNENETQNLQQQQQFRQQQLQQQQLDLSINPVNGRAGDIHLYELQQKIDNLGEDYVMQILSRRNSIKRFRPNTMKRDVCIICKNYNEYLLFCSECGQSQHLYCAKRFCNINNLEETCCACRGDLDLKAVPLRTEQIYNDDYYSDDDAEEQSSLQNNNDDENFLDQIQL